MKAVYLSMFFLCITVALALVSNSGLLDINLVYQEELIDDFEGWHDSLQPYSKPLADEKEFVSQDSESQDRGTGFFDVAIRALFPNVLLQKSFGIDSLVAFLISVPIYLIHAVALAQVFGLIPSGESSI